MYQNTLRLELYPAGDVELDKILLDYAPIVWEMTKQYQVNTVKEFTDMLISDASTWDSAIVAFDGDNPVGILAASSIMQCMHYSGKGVHVQHIFTPFKGVGGYMYKCLVACAKAAELQWVSTAHPDIAHDTIRLRFHKLRG